MRHTFKVFDLSLLALGVLPRACPADNPPAGFDQVEEDWQLVVATPDAVGVGPQITTTMSPTGDLQNDPFVAFDVNYRQYPDFLAGGMQVQAWSGDQVLATSAQGNGQFATANEMITWTQQMLLSSGAVSYRVMNGQSTTWSKFGQGAGQLTVSFSTSLTSLGAYSPADSINTSGVSWGSDRVTSMQIVQVRYYQAGQLVFTDRTARPISLDN